jgi:23S rRNA pseudouridine1911/1915/1917 synthase
MTADVDDRASTQWIVEEAQADTRADVFLASALSSSRSEAQRLLKSAAATVDGRTVKSNYRLHPGEQVAVVGAAAVAPARAQAESIPLTVVYEDADLLVIDKPRGMVVHPAPGAQTGTLVNAVLAHAIDLSGIGGEERPGIVHRLDKDTSGLLVVAKTDAAHASLQRQIQEKTAARQYVALVWGAPTYERATVEAPIGRHPADRKRMAVITDPAKRARDAITDFELRERLGPFTLLTASLRTGRTHQIRVHCAYIGHPVVGDPLYGGRRKLPRTTASDAASACVAAAIEALGGQALHAAELSFVHPRTGEAMTFNAPVPAVMQDVIDAARAAYGG